MCVEVNMYHSRLKGSPHQMGFRYGNLLARQQVPFPPMSPAHLDFGERCLPHLQAFDPRATEEIEGFAEGWGVSSTPLGAFLLGTGAGQYIPQCSVYAMATEDGVVVGRNYDMLFSARKHTDASWVQGTDAHPYLGHSDAFIGKVDGINTHGLFIAILAVPSGVSSPGVNFYFPTRKVLETCRTVQEALEVLEGVRYSMTFSLLCADASGDMAVLEVAPGQTQVRRPPPGQPYIFCTNQFQSAEMQHFNVAGLDWSQSSERYQTLHHALAALAAAPLTLEAMTRPLQQTCLNLPRVQFGTLFSWVARLETLEVWRAEGSPVRTPYREDVRLSLAGQRPVFEKG